MAKKALLDVLEQTIGKYVRNLDAESLNVAVWSGQIELHSLELDVDAVNAELHENNNLRHHNIPFRVCGGKFDSLQVEVPWAHLMSRPVRIRARGLQVSLEANDESNKNSNSSSSSNNISNSPSDTKGDEADAKEDQRIKAIQRADDFRKKANALTKLAEQDLASASSSSAQNSSFGARLVRRIIENIQMEIQDVHISLVDNDSAAGVVLESLQLVTTDALGNRAFVDRTTTNTKKAAQSFLHKALAITGFGIYMDERTTGMTTNKRPLMAISETANPTPPAADEHDYVLAPLSFNAKLRQADANVCVDFPKYKLESELSSLAILLSKPQVETAYKIAHSLRPSPSGSQPLFPEYRPLQRVSKHNAKEWWKYACRCIGRLSGRTLWREYFEAFQRRQRYVELYKRHAHHTAAGWLTPLSLTEKKEVDAIHQDRSVSMEGLMLWRNIADAQFEKEQEKHTAARQQQQKLQRKPTKSLFNSLFGGTAKTAATTSAGDATTDFHEGEEEPPIALTTQELKELEEAVILDREDDALVSGKLCDVQFTLASLRVHLTSYQLRPLAALEMGTVSTALRANVDGSFAFDFQLSSLEIHDKVTATTTAAANHNLFPTILRNQVAPLLLNDNNDGKEAGAAAFRIHLSKNPAGDKNLRVVLHTFEMIASPVLLTELRRFCSVSNLVAASRGSSSNAGRANPILAQSLSGSVDLFYDASEGVAPRPPMISSATDSMENVFASTDATRATDFSLALVDAWKAKTEEKAALFIDLDLQAPILVVPENCVDPRANVLVFDLGHLRLRYGGAPAPMAEKWFQENQLEGATADVPLDYGSLKISSLTFLVGQANDWRRLVTNHDETSSFRNNEAVVEPITMSMEFAVEADKKDPRVCAFGNIPSISLGLSLEQVLRIVSVGNAWKKLQASLFPNSDGMSVMSEEKEPFFALSRSRASSFDTTSTVGKKVPPSEERSVDASQNPTPNPRFFMQAQLQRFSASILTDKGPVMEAHLVSVSTSISSLSDGSSLSRLSMGWFWIVDRLDNKFVRQQRLLAHSTLPFSNIEELGKDCNFDIMQELERLGVFREGQGGISNVLADITLKQASDKVPLPHDPKSSSEKHAGVVLHAKFSSLYLNWNPLVIKVITTELQKFQNSLEANTSLEAPLIVSAATPVMSSGVELTSAVAHDSSGRIFLLKIELEGFQLCLNSAKDDLPLFYLTMSDTTISRLSYDASNRETLIVLGNLTIVSPGRGRTDPLYRTILGLAPGQKGSLLTVKFYEGPQCLAKLPIRDVKAIEAYGDIELSPMRLVYIHAQVLALVEYATAGILGALAAQAASTAAAAAAELATASNSKKVFHVEAASLEVVVPQAAYRPNAFSVYAGALKVDYETLADTSSKAIVALTGFELRNSDGSVLQDDSIQMSVKVSMPPEEIGSKHDQAMRVSITMEKAGFVIPKRQYAQILATLAENVGDDNLYLRDATNRDTINTFSSANQTDDNPMTHAGIAFVDNPRRIYVDVAIGTMSLELTSQSVDDSIVKLAGIDATIRHEIYPDEERSFSKITLRNLTCDDLRDSTFTRQYRSLIYQPSGQDETEVSNKDVFSLVYEKRGETVTSLDVAVGSPHLVFIPDAVADILAYIEGDDDFNIPAEIAQPQADDELPSESDYGQGNDDEQSASRTSSTTTSLSLRTSKCSVILVDLGTDAVLMTHGTQSASQVASVAETIVFEGKFEASVTLTKDARSNELLGVNAHVHGEELESYTAFGRGLDSALQMIEPTRLSLYVRQNMSQQPHSNTKEIDVRCAAMEPIDVSISMRNVALISAIMTSVSACFEKDEDIHEPDFLNAEEAKRIEQLASALEADGADQSSLTHPLSTHSTMSSFAEPDLKESTVTTVSVQLTAPGAKLAVINDLQGLDEPLFRLAARNSVANARIWEAQSGRDAPSSSYTSFDFNTNVSVLADFFDHTSNSWKPLLSRPWEVTWKGHRGPSERFKSSRPSTTIDVECFPCYLSFSEQFLMDIASANQMWAVYSRATESALIETPGSDHSSQLRRSLAASAARKFVVSLPYAIENHTGVDVVFIIGEHSKDRRSSASGSLEYFRFRPPRGRGSAGKRQYGQDTVFDKNVSIAVGGSTFQIRDVDSLSGTQKRFYPLNDGGIIVVNVVREGKTTVIHLSSGIEIINNSTVPFLISLVGGEETHSLGICEGEGRGVKPSNLTSSTGTVCKKARQFGVPIHLARKFWLDWSKKQSASVCLMVTPQVENSVALNGIIEVGVNVSMLNVEGGRSSRRRFDVTCRPSAGGSSDPTKSGSPFVLKATLITELVDGRLPSVKLMLKSRAKMENLLPVSINVRSPMPHIFGKAVGDDTFELTSKSSLEIFTPGPSIAVLMKCTDLPVGGSATSWIEGGWIDLPLATEFRLLDPLRCIFPFTRRETDSMGSTLRSGTEVFISQGNTNLLENTFESAAKDHGGSHLSEPHREVEMSSSSSEDDFHKFFVTSCFYAVDHTGDILFEQLSLPPKENVRRSLSDSRRRSSVQPASAPLGAFATPNHAGRITMLPGSKPIRLLHLTMEGDAGMRRSRPFQVEEVLIGEGGVDSTPIVWEDGSQSGFFAYRQLVNSHQSEIHVVPEYIVFNGSEEDKVRVRQPGGLESVVDAGAIAPLRTSSEVTPVISVECVASGGRTSPMRVDSLGLRVAIVKAPDGRPIGSIAIQTVVGGLDSRLVVKLGGLKYGATDSEEDTGSGSLLKNDFLRFRVQWTELQLSMYEARPVASKDSAFLESAFDQISGKHIGDETWVTAREKRADENRKHGAIMAGPVCTILFHRFTVDWQRVFKDEVSAKQLAFRSPERSQLSVIIHSVVIKDDTPNSPYPVVFDSSTNANFLDLCIRFKGPLDAELVMVDLFDLRLAHSDNVSERIVVKTSEDFVWKFLDLADRILSAAGEFAGYVIELEWDEEHDGYKVALRDRPPSYIENTGRYSPPKSDTLYDIKRARVSPFNVVVSFKRNPNVDRYALKRGVKGANLINYFTRQLKFQIKGAELKFARYEAHNVKGPPDRLVELLSTVYFSRMKMKLLTIMSAASFQDWKSLAARQEGDDDFVEGDILRVTGNLLGKTAGLFAQKTGKGLGKGVSLATGALGDGIESGTTAIGLQPVGAGVNSVVSGVGDGVAQTLTGVGRGGGHVLRGAGKGVGHVFGGVTGGAVQMGKGIGKGIARGDGRAVVSGITEGATSVATGVGQGVESVVTGTTEGVLSVGHGLFSGVKTLGRGIGGAFTGKKARRGRDSDSNTQR